MDPRRRTAPVEITRHMNAKKHANRGHENTRGYKPTGYARGAAKRVARAKCRAALKAERKFALREQGI